MTTIDYTDTEIADKVIQGLRGPLQYSAADPDGYDTARRAMKDFFGFTRESDLNERTNWAAELFRREDANNAWPRGHELIAYQPYIQAVNLLATGKSDFPAVFGISDEAGGVQWIANNRFQWSPYLAGLDGNPVNAKTFTPEQVENLSISFSPISRGPSGPAGRKARTFDRRQLSEAATDRWRIELLEEPEDAELDRLISDYISEANAFWMQEAGSLDFDTFVTDRTKRQERWSFLYSKKPDFQSTAEYMGGFRQTVSQFGLSSAGTLRQLEIGASSGAGLAGFGERVSRTREARTINQGAFSQRLAATLANSGLGGS